MSNYFTNIFKVAQSIRIGMGITLSYFRRKETITTIQYPRELEMVADRHRGIHYLETEKCILCDMCSKACPVTCIDITGSRDGEFEGSFAGSKAWMSKFTIDYGECLACNLCIEVCPKDCIHMKPKHLLDTNPAGYEGSTGFDNVRYEYNFAAYRREDLVKNLLTDQCFTTDDLAYSQKAEGLIDELAAETKRKKAEAKAKRLAEKKAAEEAKKAEEAQAATEEKPAETSQASPKESPEKETPPADKPKADKSTEGDSKE